MPIPAAPLIQAGLGIVEGAIGLINAGKTKREAAELARNRPQYEISPTVGQDLSLAESELGQGMSSAASKAYNDLNNGQFSTSLGAILRSGGTSNDIGSLYGNSQEGRLRLTMMKDQLRLNQIQNLVRARQNLQQEEQTQWQVDKFAPWQDKAQANAAARLGANSQVMEGLNTFGGGAMNAANSIQEQNALSLPTGITGANGSGYNNYRATGVPDVDYNTQYPQAGSVSSYNRNNF